jgi:ribosomal protein S18 acetylase RimI-like enzyme
MRIREALPADANEIVGLLNLAFADDKCGVTPATPGEISQAQGTFLVLTDDRNEVVGCVHFCVRHRRPRIEAEFDRLAVRPDCQNNGHGRALLADVETRSRQAGAASISLTVCSENARAIRIYRKAGYEETEISRAFGVAETRATRMMLFVKPLPS